MSRPTAPERERTAGRPVAHESRPGADTDARRRQLEQARARVRERHERIMGFAPPPVERNRWVRFVRLYGWRAYALPVLVVLTVLALFTMTTSSQSDRASAGAPAARTSRPAVAAPSAAASSSTVAAATQAPADELLGIDDAADAAVLKSFQLPAGAAYTEAGNGTFNSIPGTSAVFGTGPLKTFSIEVEQGITGVDLNQFAATVMSTLQNRQSWIGGNNVSLQRKDSGSVDFHIQLTTPMTVRKLCGYTIPVETSCYTGTGAGSEVVLNLARWVRGAASYFNDVDTYRVYAVNHEVGHALGHDHAHQCLADGSAPVMMQQTIGLKTAAGTCRPNQWPYPPGATDAPGAEQSSAAADVAFAKLQGA